MEEASTLNWSSLPGPVLQLVRQSCAAIMQTNEHVTIDGAALTAFAQSLDHSRLHRQPKRMYPLHFPTVRSEINFLCTLSLLQVGSGWRRALHAQRGGKGAADTVTFGVMGMHISGEITADAMLRVGLFDVAQLFGLKIQEEYELSPGIHSERPTALYSLAQTLRKIINDTGSMLRNLACEDWADFWLRNQSRTARVEEVDEAAGGGAEAPRPKAEDAVKRLVRYFSALQDAYVLPARKEAAETAAAASEGTGAAAAAAPAAAAESKEAAAPASASSSSSSGAAASAAADQRVVYILKKAQLMVADLERRFGDDPSLPFNFSDMDSLTVFSDNVLPAVLRAKGVLLYSPSLAALVDSDSKPISNREQEASIRAAAVVACERIVDEFNAHHSAAGDAPRLNSVLLDYHLWQLGKEPDMRKLPRHATHSAFY